MGCGCANCHMTDDVTMSAECADISTSGFSQEEPMSESALEGYIEDYIEVSIMLQYNDH